MIYDIRQITEYDYASPVAYARHILRMTPRSRPGQHVIAADLTVEPLPTLRIDEQDFFGNDLIRLSLDEPHDKLTLTLRARVAVDPPTALDPHETPTWERARDLAFQIADLSPLSPVHFLFESRYVPRSPVLRAYAAESFRTGAPVLAAAFDLAGRIRADFAYDPEATAIDTPAETAFAMKRGVCQDFAHIMIAGLRGLGVPAAYVSGFLRTIPPPGRKRLEGADATHAWVAVWCGLGVGWRGVDPTNGVMAGVDHVVVAMGRDYADVSPGDGVFLAAGDHELSVKVDVVPLV